MKKVKFALETIECGGELISRFDLHLPMLKNEILIVQLTPLDFISKLAKIDYKMEQMEFTCFKGWVDIPIRKVKYQNSNYIINSAIRYHNKFALLCKDNTAVVFCVATALDFDFRKYNKKFILKTNFLPNDLSCLITKYIPIVTREEWIYSILCKI